MHNCFTAFLPTCADLSPSPPLLAGGQLHDSMMHSIHRLPANICPAPSLNAGGQLHDRPGVAPKRRLCGQRLKRQGGVATWQKEDCRAAERHRPPRWHQQPWPDGAVHMLCVLIWEALHRLKR